MIKSYLRGQQTEWDQNLGCLAAVYRATPTNSTHLTPNLLMLGREVRAPAEVVYGCNSNETPDTDTYGAYVSCLNDRMVNAHEVARKHLKQSAKVQKDAYDAKVSLHRYQPGDLVWYLSFSQQLNIAPKLRNPYEGPCLVLKRNNDINYLIQASSKRNSRKVVIN